MENMHDRIASRIGVATIDRRGHLTYLSRVDPAFAAAGITNEQIVGQPAWGGDKWSTPEKPLGSVATTLLTREPTASEGFVEVGGRRIILTHYVYPVPKGAVTVYFESHTGPPLETMERRVLRHIADGMGHAEIAAIEDMHESTSKRHMERAKAKLAAKTGCHAVALSVLRGLI